MSGCPACRFLVYFLQVIVMHISWKSGLFILFLLLIFVPYGVAAVAAGPGYVFGGFLLNPADGNSYLAKMYEGWAGSWMFQLPFTAEPGAGAYLFMFYLFLGHLARWTGLPLLWMFHLTRLLAAGFLALSLHRFLGTIFEKPATLKWAISLVLFGSGLGWLALLFGGFTSDFWVAEAYPFLSALENPHFPLTLGLILWLLAAEEPRQSWKTALGDVLMSFLLATILPFGVVVLGLALAGKLAWTWLETRRFTFWRLAWVGLGGAPMLLYQLWVVSSDPVFGSWNAQNLTPSPPVWDVLVSFSPALILAVVGGVAVVRQKNIPGGGVLAWAILGLALLYVPFSLQRRLMLGLYIPLVALAAFGIEDLLRRNPLRWRRLPGLVIGLSLPTNLVVIMLAGFGIFLHAPELYLKGTQFQALAWIRGNTAEHSLVLASPEMGLRIPGWTGRRVIYGHPFETTHAVEEKRAVEDFFSERMSQTEMEAFLSQRKVDLIFWETGDPGPSSNPLLITFPVIYRNPDVTIYQVTTSR